MAPASAPVLAAAVLLVVAGVGKLRRPSYTVGAIKSVGVRVKVRGVLLLGLTEMAIGLAAFIASGPVPSALIGLSYLGFTGFVILALRKGGAVSSCGCLGRPDTPPTRTHAVVTAALGTSALATAVAGGVDVGDLGWSTTDATLLAFTALVTWLVWLAFAVLPHARTPRPGGR
jgi:hypothetical protein